jgi:hypothetical protein
VLAPAAAAVAGVALAASALPSPPPPAVQAWAAAKLRLIPGAGGAALRCVQVWRDECYLRQMLRLLAALQGRCVAAGAEPAPDFYLQDARRVRPWPPASHAAPLLWSCVCWTAARSICLLLLPNVLPVGGCRLPGGCTQNCSRGSRRGGGEGGAPALPRDSCCTRAPAASAGSPSRRPCLPFRYQHFLSRTLALARAAQVVVHHPGDIIAPCAPANPFL